MDLTPYLDRLRADLTQTAAAGDDQVRAGAERLTAALEPAFRLSAMEILSEAAAEITSSMRSGSVETRLSGREIDFVVAEPEAAEHPVAAASARTPFDEDDEGDLARITVRIPESIKARAEEIANRAGGSLNTWIVNVLRAATREPVVNIDLDLGSLRHPTNFPHDAASKSRRLSGWI